jgi:phosphoglycerate dehydrogenase-like enzyme
VIAWLTDERREAREHAFGAVPDGWELRDWPDDPAAAPDRRDVRFVVPSSGSAGGLEDLPAVEVVQVRSAGVDWVRDRVPPGATLCSARGARDSAVAEWVVAAIMADAKRAREVGEGQAARAWRRFGLDDVTGRHVVIVGFGSIGREAGRLLRALGCTVEGVGRHPRVGVHGLADLARLTGDADVLVDLLPLTHETEGLVDATLLSVLHAGALVVNAGRGPTLVTDDLVAELERGRLRAVLDVVDPEPLPPEHALWRTPGTVVSPHVAGDTPLAEERAWALCGSQLRRFAAGEPLRNVLGPDGY